MMDSYNSEAELKWNERISYGIGSTGAMIVGNSLSAFLMIYMTNVVYMDMAILSVLIAASKILDGITDIIVGNIIDHTHSRFGKARAWILRICVPQAVSLVLLFTVPASWPTAAKYVYFFVMFNLVSAVFLTFMQMAHFSLLSLITKNGVEHGMLSNISSLISGVIPMLINASFISILIHFSGNPDNPYTQKAYTSTFLIFGAIVILGSLICVFGTKERVTEYEEANHVKEHNFAETIKALLSDKYWIVMLAITTVGFIGAAVASTEYVYYATYVLHDPSSVSWIVLCTMFPGLIVKFFLPAFFNKFSSLQIVIFGSGIGLVGGIIVAAFSSSRPGMMTGLIISGVGLGISAGAQLALIADVIKHTEKTQGVFSAGLGNSGISAANKLGIGIGTIIMGVSMSAAGFDATYDLQNIPQPHAVEVVSTFFFIWLPIIIQVIICTLFFIFFRKGMED